MAWSKHERVVGRLRIELYIAWNTLVGVYYRVFLDAAFLLPGVGMSTHTLENSIREQSNGSGINDPELFYPIFRTVAAAVRRNYYFCPWLLMICLATPK